MSPEEINDTENRKEDVKKFINIYLSSYKDHIEKKEMDVRHLPSFYKGFPYSTEIFLLPNESVCVLFKKGKQARTVVVEGDFDEIKGKIDARSFDFMKNLAPYTKFTEDEAERISVTDAQSSLENSQKLLLLGGIETHMEQVKKEVGNMLDLNPWLDEHANVQNEKMERAKELIEALYKEIDLDKSERFVRYERDLMELRAFEKVRIEEIASEMEVEVESVMSELEEQVAGIETDFEEVKENYSREIQELRELFMDLSTKMESVKITSSMDDELEDEFKSLRSSITKSTTKMGKLEKELRSIRKEATITEEVKETVFRDSKRVHNLNERIGEIEGDLKKLASTKSKNFGPDIKALIKRLDKLEADLMISIKKAVDFEFEKRKPALIEEPPPPPLDPPTQTGTTVKKTTKTKKTKRTKKKKA